MQTIVILLSIKDDEIMNGYPPPVLVKTWLFVATSRDFDLNQVKFPIHKAIQDYFGSIELAQLYVDQASGSEVSIRSV